MSDTLRTRRWIRATVAVLALAPGVALAPIAPVAAEAGNEDGKKGAAVSQEQEKPTFGIAHAAHAEGVLAAGIPGDQPFWTPFDIGEVVLEPPFLTYTDGVTLWVDDRRVEVTHVGTPAHTTNDSLVWLPEQKTLFAGDLLFAGGTPFLVMGSLAGAIEVLEHVPDPEHTVSEMARCASGHLLVSVPREPLWRGLNMARGAYIKDLGNTPGHLNHWSKRSFVQLLSRYGTVVEARSPFPWTMLLVRVGS